MVKKKCGWHVGKITGRIWIHVIMLHTSTRVPPKLNWIFLSGLFFLSAWLTDWPNDWLTDRPTDRPSVWLTDWLNDWPSVCLTDWLADPLTVWLTEWLNDWPTNQPTDCKTDWPTDHLSDWLTDWLTDLSSEGQQNINELMADRGNVSDTEAFLSLSSCNDHHFLLSTALPTRSQQVILNHFGGHTCLSPNIFLSALLTLIPVVRWKSHYSKFERHRGFGDPACLLWIRGCGVHCGHTRALFSLKRFSSKNTENFWKVAAALTNLTRFYASMHPNVFQIASR